MAISTADCKKAIVALINAPGGLDVLAKAWTGTTNHAELVANCQVLYDDSGKAHQITSTKDILAFAGAEKYWKREAKRTPGRFDEVPSGTKTIRDFDCRPFDDQLRAYVYDDGNQILKVSIEGE